MYTNKHEYRVHEKHEIHEIFFVPFVFFVDKMRLSDV
jgi:hypothetical protein